MWTDKNGGGDGDGDGERDCLMAMVETAGEMT